MNMWGRMIRKNYREECKHLQKNLKTEFISSSCATDFEFA